MSRGPKVPEAPRPVSGDRSALLWNELPYTAPQRVQTLASVWPRLLVINNPIHSHPHTRSPLEIPGPATYVEVSHSASHVPELRNDTKPEFEFQVLPDMLSIVQVLRIESRD